MLFHLFHRCVYEWMGDVCARFFLASLSNDRATFNRFEHNSHTHAHFVVSEVAIALLYLLNYRLICFVHQFVSFCFTALRCCCRRFCRCCWCSKTICHVGNGNSFDSGNDFNMFFRKDSTSNEADETTFYGMIISNFCMITIELATMYALLSKAAMCICCRRRCNLIQRTANE